MLYEKYVRENRIKDKNEEEQKRELIKSILETKSIIKTARNNYDYAEEELIDYYLYMIKAYQSKLNYLIKKAKKNGIILDRLQDLEISKQEKAV